MISINTVRNLTMFLLNKSNNGYITPEQFNSFCELAQLDIFENLFISYNQFINKQNRRLTGTEYADIPKNIREQIDVFATYTDTSNFVYDSNTNLWSYNGTDLYRAETLSLVNTTTNKKVDIEEVQKRELNILKNSPLTTPSLLFPVCTRIGESFRIDPIVPTGYSAELFFIRVPKSPRWTYLLSQGNPVYSASATDLQDIELSPTLFNAFVVKVLSYCGLNLREEQVEGFANSNEATEWQKKQQS